MKIYVGVDWDTELAVCCYGEGGSAPRRFHSVRLDPDELVRFCDELATMGATHLVVGVEAGHELWVRLWHGCASDALAIDVHVIDGKQAKRFTESLCSSRASDDPRSAEALFLMVQSSAHRKAPWQPLSSSAQRIAATCRMHAMVTREVVRTTNRIRAELNGIAPGVNAVLKDLTANWVRDLLRKAPTPHHLRALPATERRQLKFGRQNPAAILEAYEQWEHIEGVQWRADHVRLLVEQLDLLVKQKKQLTKTLEALVAADPIGKQLLAMLGIGPKSAANLVQFAFVGDLDRRDAAALGLCVTPVTIRSGKRGRKQPLVVMRRSAASEARAAGYTIGMQVVKHLPWAKAQYQHYIRKGHNPASAYRRVTRSLLRLLTALLRDGSTYDEQRYIKCLIGHSVPWAADLAPLLEAA